MQKCVHTHRFVFKIIRLSVLCALQTVHLNSACPFVQTARKQLYLCYTRAQNESFEFMPMLKRMSVFKNIPVLMFYTKNESESYSKRSTSDSIFSQSNTFFRRQIYRYLSQMKVLKVDCSLLKLLSQRRQGCDAQLFLKFFF